MFNVSAVASIPFGMTYLADFLTRVSSNIGSYGFLCGPITGVSLQGITHGDLRKVSGTLAWLLVAVGLAEGSVMVLDRSFFSDDVGGCTVF